MLDEQWRKSTHSNQSGCVEARWVKASASSLNGCVEVRWRKAAACANGNCVEVAHNADEGMVLVRHSKRPGGGVVAFTPAAWASLLMDVAAGHFHWSRFSPLEFDATERAAFEAGVVAGEFDLEVAR